jgi:hypothetical protein
MFPDLNFCMIVMMNEKANAPEIDEGRVATPVHPGSETLRRAIHGNIVSFPSQIPTLLKCPPADTQWRIVLLFFVRGWSASKIAARFNVPRHRIWKILNGWSVRALALGYIQVIDPEAFAACCNVDVEYSTVGTAEEVEAAAKAVSLPRPGSSPAGGSGTSVDLIASLDAAIAECEAWREEFGVRTATLLRELRTAAAALDRRRPGEPTDPPFAAPQIGETDLQYGLRVGEEERVSHAVA